MAFRVFQPVARYGIPRGSLSLSARGMARFNRADLAAVGIEDRGTLLIDPERRSLALRGPLEGEQGVLIGAENHGPAKTVWLSGAMKAAGLEPADLHGWHECEVREDRLEIKWKERRAAPKRRKQK